MTTEKPFHYTKEQVRFLRRLNDGEAASSQLDCEIMAILGKPEPVGSRQITRYSSMSRFPSRDIFELFYSIEHMTEWAIDFMPDGVISVFVKVSPPGGEVVERCFAEKLPLSRVMLIAGLTMFIESHCSGGVAKCQQ